MSGKTEKTEISEKNRRLAKHVAGIFGGTPSANRYGDEAQKSFIDIMTAVDSPVRTLASFSTFGLSDHPNPGGPKGRQLPVEIVGACGADVKKFDKALSTAAFCLINSKRPCRPGAIFPDCLGLYGISKTMKHFFFITPCLWTEDLKPLRVGKKTITWLLAVPISDEERKLAEKDGPARLDGLFEKKRIDIPDINRPSVL